MITKPQQVRLDFGQGNIGIRITRDIERSYLVFNDIEPKPIGDLGTEEGAYMTFIDLLDAPVMMSFSNVESIDALIGALQRARESMLLPLTSEGDENGDQQQKGIC